MLLRIETVYRTDILVSILTLRLIFTFSGTNKHFDLEDPYFLVHLNKFGKQIKG